MKKYAGIELVAFVTALIAVSNPIVTTYLPKYYACSPGCWNNIGAMSWGEGFIYLLLFTFYIILIVTTGRKFIQSELRLETKSLPACQEPLLRLSPPQGRESFFKSRRGESDKCRFGNRRRSQTFRDLV